jgi:hypothetical protein
MGWELAEEVAAARPERPGPEWWTLMDLALDARTETRQGMPGHDLLMDRAKCSRATLYRRLKTLKEARLIKVVRESAPGQRAIYEIALLHEIPEMGLTTPETHSGLTNPETRSGGNGTPTGLAIAETRTGLTNAEMCTDEVIHNGSQNEAERVSKIGERVSPLHDSHSVSYPVTTTPSDTSPLLTSPSVEGSGDREIKSQISFTGTRAGTDAERRKQADALTAWQREHPEPVTNRERS